MQRTTGMSLLYRSLLFRLFRSGIGHEKRDAANRGESHAGRSLSTLSAIVGTSICQDDEQWKNDSVLSGYASRVHVERYSQAGAVGIAGCTIPMSA
jgi:hypothetical protein